MNVCYCFTGEWAKYIPVQLYALFSKNPQIQRVYLICDYLPLDIERKLQQFPYQWIKPNSDAFNRVNIKGRFTVATLWRLLIPFHIQDSKCLYLDADTIVTDSLQELDGYHPETVAGVEDVQISVKHLMSMGHRRAYINAGVLLMNLDGIRREGLHQKWLHLANKRKFHCQDQDIINVTTTPLLLPNDYNSSVSTGFSKDPKIVHYAGPKINWVDGMPLEKVWKYWEKLYDTKGDSLRLVRKETKAGIGS